MATISDIQSKISTAMTRLEATTTSGSAFVKQYGSDWTKWPQTSNWYIAFKALHDASVETGQLTKLAANFTAKEVTP